MPRAGGNQEEWDIARWVAVLMAHSRGRSGCRSRAEHAEPLDRLLEAIRTPPPEVTVLDDGGSPVIARISPAEPSRA